MCIGTGRSNAGLEISSSSKAEGATAEELNAHCRSHLAGFKVPKRFVFGPVPKTNTGKIQKFLLRQKAVSAAAIDV